jgi:hypothetical protein
VQFRAILTPPTTSRDVLDTAAVNAPAAATAIAANDAANATRQH